MMRFVLASSVVLSAAVTSSAQQAVPIDVEGDYVNEASGFVFREKVDEFERVGVSRYDELATNVSAGYAWRDGPAPTIITVFVYPIPQIDGALISLEHQFDLEQRSVRQAHPGTLDVTTGEVTVRQNGEPVKGLTTEFILPPSPGGWDIRVGSILYLFQLEPWTVKVRATFPEQETESGRAVAKRFIDALSSSGGFARDTRDQGVFDVAPITREQAGEVAALIEKTTGGADGVSAQLSASEKGYSLWLAFPGENRRDPQLLESAASLAGSLVSAAVLDGAPLTVHVSYDAPGSKQTVRIELAPEDVFFFRGEALVYLDRNVEAIEQFRKAVDLRPTVTRYLLRYGEVLFLEWRDAEAERAYRAATALEPNNARAHFLRGELKFQHGQLKESLPFYRRAVELEPDFGRGHEMLASNYDLLGRYDEAITHYERAIELEPTATRYTELGITYRNKKQLDDAIARFRTGIELFPDDPLLYRNLAGTLVMAGRGDQSQPVFLKALQLYRRAADNEPENPGVHTSLGFMLAEVEDFDGAIVSFRRALVLDPRAPLTWGGLGDAYISTKRFDEAIDAFLKMVELQPNDGYAHHRLGNALETAGRTDEAEAAFARARRLGFPQM